jgi:valyl-tRNA synthetase
MMLLQELIVSIRNLRAELKVEPKEKTGIRVHTNAEVEKLVKENRSMLERLANVEDIQFVPGSLANEKVSRATARFEVALIYEQKIDVAAETERITKELNKNKVLLASAETRLNNQQFLSKAPPEIVEGLKKQVEELKVIIEKLRRRLDGLK